MSFRFRPLPVRPLKFARFPTWILPNGERRVGVQSLEELERWSDMSPSP